MPLPSNLPSDHGVWMRGEALFLANTRMEYYCTKSFQVLFSWSWIISSYTYAVSVLWPGNSLRQSPGAIIGVTSFFPITMYHWLYSLIILKTIVSIFIFYCFLQEGISCLLPHLGQELNSLLVWIANFYLVLWLLQWYDNFNVNQSYLLYHSLI